jgi:hypothetical protein
LAVGGVYAYHSTRHKTVTSSKVVTNKASNSLGTASITEPVTTTVNCGSDSCFATYFQKCSPATETADSPMANVKYQIYGKKNNGCNMQFEYLATPNPAWDNKSMICIFDNSQSLDNAVSAVITNLSNKKNDYSCAGPLVALLQNQ